LFTIPPHQPLPIDDVLPALLAALDAHTCGVLRAPTGAGKTTRVPPALSDRPFAAEGKIIVLQPRRMAARTAARRMAFERGVRLGEEIGYQVRFDERAGPQTRISVVTEGVLLRMLHDDPFLERISAVVFDEFHERNLNSDLALGMVRRLQQTVRPELKVVVMSATLAAEPIAAYLGGCPVVESEGRLYPVEIRYQQRLDRRPLPVQAATGVEQILSRTEGDVLVFLPGVGEIRQTARELQPLAARHNLAVMELYGDLPAEQQDAVLNPCDRRKVVLSTNVAETSLTIEGITGVVDTGFARQMQFDAAVGLDRLELTPISQASADQRTGRAGRTQPGVCLRLWDDRSHRRRPEHDQPEIRRVDLAGPVLQLLCWGEQDVLAFPWFEPPSEAAVEQAVALLQRLGALNERTLTPLGRTIARLPVHPRIGRLLVEGHRLGHPDRMALAGALLTERSPFLKPPVTGTIRRGSGQPTADYRSRSDVLDRIVALEEFAMQGRRQTEVGEIHVGAAHFLFRARDQFSTLLYRELGPAEPAEISSDEAVLRALLAAFSDRLARRREPHSPKGVLVGGRGVRLAPQSAVTDAELFVCVDVDAGQTEAQVRQASAVEREWLPTEPMRTADEVFFHPSQKRVAARRRTYWGDLLLDESTAPLPDGPQVAEVLAQAARSHWDRVFPNDDAALMNFLMRVRCLAEWMPELELPTFDDGRLRDLLETLCFGCRSFDELRNAPWLASLQARLSPSQYQAVEREAPERLQVPSGSRVTLQYEAGKPPILAVRIQEVFGWRETPRIAGGRIPVLLHLLAPNMRPQQVTDDLRSFWDTTYPQVRKDLRRRYPKHAWPDDPWNACAESRPGRRG
jgi:ATP-dependent helicase HrpB